jgi:hypothetical protein
MKALHSAVLIVPYSPDDQQFCCASPAIQA